MKHALLACALALAAGTAFAHNCPNEMKAIDAKLATHPKLFSSDADAAKVKQLRRRRGCAQGRQARRLMKSLARPRRSSASEGAMRGYDAAHERLHLAPLDLGSRPLPNRVLMGSMHTGLEDGRKAAAGDGRVLRRARGGVG